jgi:predicted CopG family antitoxin
VKTIAVDETTWKKLKELKDRLGLQSYNDLIATLVEEWKLAKIKEQVNELEFDIDPKDAISFFKSRQSSQRRT